MDNSFLQEKKEKKAKIKTEKIYTGKIINLRVDTSIYEDKTTKKTEIVEHRGAVLIIPLTSDNKIIFIKQYRKATDQILIELPAGTLEVNEIPQKTAIRELQEEIGYIPKKIIDIGYIYTSPGFCTEIIHIFIAYDLKKSQLIAEDTHGIDSIELSLDEACDLIKKNQIVDGKTIAAVFKYINTLDLQ
jgi:ADP-ribose pyrophosphatase